MSIKCPSCNDILNTILVCDFYYCKKCGIAVRSEEKMPLPDKNIYKEDWVSSQVKTRYLLYRAYFALKQIKKIKGVNKVLDIACGIGVLVNLLNQKNFKADGIDFSPEAIEYARSHNKGNYYLNSIDNFNPEYKYDFVTATQIIEHLRKPVEFFKKIIKHLKPGGYLYIETPNLDSFNKNSLWRRRVGGMRGRDHRIIYSPGSLSDLVIKNGFTISRVFTKTYPSKMFTAYIDSIYFDLYKRGKTSSRTKKNNDISIKKKHNSIKKILLRIYARIIYSLFLEVIFYIPNRISETKGKGVQTIIVAQKK